MKTKLDQYIGALSPIEIATGINKARGNAKRLLEDEELLINSGKFPSGTALSILSIEESGKASILMEISTAKDEVEAKKYWKHYRSHTSKNAMWLFVEIFKDGGRKLDDFKILFNENAEHPHLLDQVKQICIYTDCLGDKHWSCPAEVVNEQLANSILFIAKILLSKREATQREIELWIKHMKPVKGVSASWANKALENWYAEMQSEGLVPQGSNKMEEFIRHSIKNW